MPMRDSASYCRPRLYDFNDPERADDVELLLETINNRIELAMANGDRDTVEHATDLKQRILSSADDHYKDHDQGKPVDQ